MLLTVIAGCGISRRAATYIAGIRILVNAKLLITDG